MEVADNPKDARLFATSPPQHGGQLMTASLKDFVSQTLRDILDGVIEVQKDTNIGKNIAPWGIGPTEYPLDSGLVRKGPFTATVVKFDVAVTAEITEAAKAGGGLKIAVFAQKRRH